MNVMEIRVEALRWALTQIGPGAAHAPGVLALADKAARWITSGELLPQDTAGKALATQSRSGRAKG